MSCTKGQPLGCDWCNEDFSVAATRGGEQLSLGSAEVHVLGIGAVAYAAPDLIYHSACVRFRSGATHFRDRRCPVLGIQRSERRAQYPPVYLIADQAPVNVTPTPMTGGVGVPKMMRRRPSCRRTRRAAPGRRRTLCRAPQSKSERVRMRGGGCAGALVGHWSAR